jgi:hypothetical protein
LLALAARVWNTADADYGVSLGSLLLLQFESRDSSRYFYGFFISELV